LQHSTQKVEKVSLDQKTTYMEDSAIIRKMFGILRAAFWRRVGGDAVAAGKAIYDIVKGKHDTMQKMDKTYVQLEKDIVEIKNTYKTNPNLKNMSIKIIRKPKPDGTQEDVPPETSK
jgi:hypothetical protein